MKRSFSCGNYLFVNETKSHPDTGQVQRFAQKLEQVFDYLPGHEGKTVVPVFSSFSLTEPMIELLTELGIYAMALGGDTMALLNCEKIKSRS